MARSRKRGKEARYEQAVRRQLDLHAETPRWYAPPETVLRAGDNIERFMPDSPDDDQP